MAWALCRVGIWSPLPLQSTRRTSLSVWKNTATPINPACRAKSKSARTTCSNSASRCPKHGYFVFSPLSRLCGRGAEGEGLGPRPAEDPSPFSRKAGRGGKALVDRKARCGDSRHLGLHRQLELPEHAAEMPRIAAELAAGSSFGRHRRGQ